MLDSVNLFATARPIPSNQFRDRQKSPAELLVGENGYSVLINATILTWSHESLAEVTHAVHCTGNQDEEDNGDSFDMFDSNCNRFNFILTRDVEWNESRELTLCSRARKVAVWRVVA